MTNTGDVELSNVSVSDDKCAPVDYVSGDTNDDELLDLTESLDVHLHDHDRRYDHQRRHGDRT